MSSGPAAERRPSGGPAAERRPSGEYTSLRDIEAPTPKALDGDLPLAPSCATKKCDWAFIMAEIR